MRIILRQKGKTVLVSKRLFFNEFFFITFCPYFLPLKNMILQELWTLGHKIHLAIMAVGIFSLLGKENWGAVSVSVAVMGRFVMSDVLKHLPI